MPLLSNVPMTMMLVMALELMYAPDSFTRFVPPKRLAPTIQVDLGVDLGSAQTSMPQVITHFFQREVLVEQVSGTTQRWSLARETGSRTSSDGSGRLRTGSDA